MPLFVSKLAAAAATGGGSGVTPGSTPIERAPNVSQVTGERLSDVVEGKFKIVVIEAKSKDTCRGIKKTKEAFCLKRRSSCNTASHKVHYLQV